MGLEELISVEQVGPETQVDLKNLNQSLLLNFTELLELLSSKESSNLIEEKIQDMKRILINFYHLLNFYRSHQVPFFF
jgi:hypothetical protein